MKRILFTGYFFIQFLLGNAQTYYVSTSGNDGNDGLTQSTPWQTLGHAATAVTTPGAIIALKRGDIWASGLALSIQNGGTDGNPIIWDGNLWGTGSKATIQSTTDRTTPNVSLVNIIHCAYVTFQNIIIDGNNKDVYGIVVGGAENNHYSPSSSQYNENHIIVQDCEIYNCGTTATYDIGILVRPFTSDISNITIQRNKISKTGAHCISFYPVPTQYGGNGAKIKDCYVGYNSCTNYRMYLGNTGYGIHINNNSRNVLIEHNTITTGDFGFNPCIDIESNDPTLGIYPLGITVRYNYLHAKDNWGIVTFEGQGITADIYGNVITNIGGTGTRGGIWLPNYTGDHAYTGHFNIYNNTIYVDGSVGFKDHTAVTGTVNFENNIVVNSGTDGACVWIKSNQSSIHNNNLLYRSGAGDLTYVIDGSYLTKSGVAGWEPSSLTLDPLFNDINGLDFHQLLGSPVIGAGVPITGVDSDLDGISFKNPPSLGCFEYFPGFPDPLFQNATVSDALPGTLVLTYDISLDSLIIPSTSAFTVKINGSTRSVSQIFISGSTVKLALSSNANPGDVITVAYTKPVSNTLQSVNGKEAASFTAKSVLNGIIDHAPVYLSSVVEDATPSLLEMTYDKNLNESIIPATSAFNVQVNGVRVNINSISIVGSKVTLILRDPIVNGDVITVTYSNPGVNPLQGTGGAQIVNLTSGSVTNKCFSVVYVVDPVFINAVVEDATPSVIELEYNLEMSPDSLSPMNAFEISVNGASRPVDSIGIQGSTVSLFFGIPFTFSDTIKLSYSRPTSMLLQTPLGGLAANLTNIDVTNNINSVVSPENPTYQNSFVEDSAPSLITLRYDKILDSSSIPDPANFNIQVNFFSRTVDSLKIIDSLVLLYLNSEIVYGDIVTVGYSKPGNNEIITPTGGIAASISSKDVVNNVKEVIIIIKPEYNNSSVENATPKVIQSSFNQVLDGSSIPDISAFHVIVNSTQQTISSIDIAGSQVYITLDTAIEFGENITLSYYPPTTSPLKSPSGGLVDTLINEFVSNNVAKVFVNSPPQIVAIFDSLYNAGFVGQVNASQSFDPDGDELSFEWIVNDSIPISSANTPTLLFLAPVVNSSMQVSFTLRISDGITTVSKDILTHIIPYKPELKIAEISDIEASTYDTPFVPENIIDNNFNTIWSSSGEDQWVTFHLKNPFKINYLEIAFLKGQRRESYFDIETSNDKINWEPVISDASSCSFSGDLQIFSLPDSYVDSSYNYIRLVGMTNSEDNKNSFSELKIFGNKIIQQVDFDLYPNPASNWINISNITDSNNVPHLIRIFNIQGSLLYEVKLDLGEDSVRIPISLPSGMYIVHVLGSGIIESVKDFIVINQNYIK